jgi:NTP pyrophosphatase (non-canonical NTP hydrolase)
MKPDFEKVSKCVVKQNEHIEIFSRGSKEQLAGWLSEELLELLEVLEKGSYDEISLMSEVGDVQYLLIRLSQMCGIDLMECVLSKVARNYKKYDGKPDRESARAEWGDKDHEFLSDWVKQYRIKQGKVDSLNQNL